MQRARITGIALVLLSFFSVGPAARGAAYLVGAQLYSCSSDGTNGGSGPYGPEYQYSTNAATAHLPLSVDGIGTGISFPLVDGANVFSFTTGGIDPGDYACLNLFFDDSDAPYSRPYEAGIGVPGALAAIAPVAGAGFAIPAAGTDVQSYNSSGTSVNATSYSGAAEVSVDGIPTRITAFTVDAQINGSFTLTLPEPDVAMGRAAAAAALAWLARRRA
jgi:hypothetical protein